MKYEELTAFQLNDLCKMNRVILLTFGSIEQHSSHLPVGTDYICMLKRVEEIAERTNNIVFAPIQIGYSFNHIGMTGTISLDAKIFIDVVRNILEQLFEQGWRRVLIFSGHNGNWASLEVATQITRERFPNSQIIFSRGYPKSKNQTRFIKNFDYHAGTVETALVSYFSKIDLDNLPTPNENLPKSIVSLLDKDELDDIDRLLISGLTPGHTNLLSKNGIWGRDDPSNYDQIPVDVAMKQYIDFFVELLQRWDKIA
ncbi:MAG: creatininase family protein [Selenomonadaceae bacterium]|nr:creatininase family protein [Selenomonadaceae bacterium]